MNENCDFVTNMREPAPLGRIGKEPIDQSVVQAARILGRMPKTLFGGRRTQRRNWTGFIAGQRCWLGRLVELPDARVVRLESVRRGTAIVLIPKAGDAAGFERFSVPTTNLRLVISPEAVALGRRKLGVVERRSPQKAASARRNGARPVKPGNRKRGRPRKDAPIWSRFVLSTLQPPKRQSTDALFAWMLRQRAEIDRCVKDAAALDAENRRRKEALPRLSCG